MSNERSTGNGSHAETLKSASKTNGKKELKAKKERIPRQNPQDYLMQALAGHKDGLPIEQLEAACQKLHKHADDRYSHVAKQQFACTKDKDGGITVLPAVSDKGFYFGARFSLENNGLHWTLRTFPREALESLRKQKFDRIGKVEALLNVVVIQEHEYHLGSLPFFHRHAKSSSEEMIKDWPSI